MQAADVLRALQATLDRLTPAAAQDMARQMTSAGGRDQATKLSRDLMRWSQRNADRMRETVQREIAAQLSSIGVATADDVRALTRRVDDLERALRRRDTREARGARTPGGGTASTKPAPDKPSSAKATTKAARRKSTAAGAGSERGSSARKSASPNAPSADQTSPPPADDSSSRSQGGSARPSTG
jgi:polyhydroxyalkanoate synthesis regulator phasin